MRHLAVIATLLLGLASAALAETGAAAQDASPVAVPSAGPTRTDVRYFLPFAEGGLVPGLRVAGRESGPCDAESVADVGRPDAWVCTGSAGNVVHDPCFENPFASAEEPAELACVASPFAADAVLFTPTLPLRREKDADDGASRMQPGRQNGDVADQPPPGGGATDADRAEEVIDPFDVPWALELANGKQCTLLTGASVVLAGLRVNYGCEGGGSVLGRVDRGQPVWTVSYLDEGQAATRLVEVTVAWT